MENSDEKEKKRRGRPSKAHRFMEAVRELIPETGDWNAWVIACTDEDLLFMLNSRLDKEERIDERTWRNYKKGLEGIAEVDRECLDAFISAYKRSLLGMKRMCVEKLEGDVPGGWQRYAWLLERKYDEWNMTRKEKVEVSDLGRLVLRGRDEGELSDG
jgi:hypothetical protein